MIGSHHSHRVTVALAAAIISLLFTACAEKMPTSSGAAPVIEDVRLEANPHNVLSAVVTLRASGATHAFIEYSTDTLHLSRTPAFALRGDSVQLPLVGLHAESLYHLRIVAVGAGGEQGVSAPHTFTTGAIPADMPRYIVSSSGRGMSPGYVMFGFTSGDTSLGGFYAVIVDNEGRPVWYRKFDTQIADIQKQPNGTITIFSSLGSGSRRFFELDLLGNIIAEHAASNGRETGAHEYRRTLDGSILFGIKDTIMDLSAIGGRRDAMVKGMIVEYDRGARGVLRWSTFDHLHVDEAAADIDITAPAVTPWHVNAIDLDTDGNLLLSLRNSDMVIKVDANDGRVLWRLGGKRNQFTFINDPRGGFSHQHGIRRLPNGNILLFDNGNLHQPQASRVVEYKLDESAKTAELVWEYLHEPSLYAFALGFAQRIPNGHTLVCYGTESTLIEVDAAKGECWRLALASPGYFIYRAFRIDSIY